MRLLNKYCRCCAEVVCDGYTHRNSKFRFSENILGPSLKITQSANPRDTSVSLAVCLNHNFQIRPQSDSRENEISNCDGYRCGSKTEPTYTM